MAYGDELLQDKLLVAPCIVNSLKIFILNVFVPVMVKGLNNGIPLMATPIGPMGSAVFESATLGLTGTVHKWDWVSMSFGLPMLGYSGVK